MEVKGSRWESHTPTGVLSPSLRCRCGRNEFFLQVDSYDVRVGEDLGGIVLVKLQKKKFWVHDDWYCRYITVKTPAGDYVEFPCFHWLVDDTEVVLRDGRGGCPLLSTCFTFIRSPLLTPHSPPPTPCLLCPVFVSVVAFLPQDDKISLVKQHRQKELELRRKTYGQVLQALVCVHWCVRPCSTINEYLNAAFSDGRSGSQASR